jgi:phospholipid/cholesterol/gamma-HCH transport system substrate-binding protein
MAGQAQKLKIGLFVVASLLIVVAGVIWLSASRYFENSRTVVAYFNETVQGLDADSPVKFRGVKVGRVKDIKMAPDGRLVEVTMALDKNFRISDDLGVKMNLLGLTGLKYLEMDTFKPDLYKETVQIDFTPKYKVIQTYPSDIREIGNALENVFQKIKTLDLERISNNLVQLTSRLDTVLKDVKLGHLSSEASETLREVRETARRINDEVARAQISRSVNKTLEKATAFFQESTETSRSADRMIRRADNNLNGLTQKLDRAADNVIDFTRMIKQKPSSIFFGSDEKSQK